MIHALIPAGGQSTRMGQPKLLLPLGGYTVIEHLVTRLRDAGLERILVVAPPDLPKVGELAEAAGGTAFILPQPTAGMRETVEAGLAWIEYHWRPAQENAWLLQPGDHPFLRREVIRALQDAWQAHPERKIFVPTCNGPRGHPTLIGWSHVVGIRAFPAGQGLNAYLRSHAEATLEVPVEHEEILWNLDTPADYERLRNKL